MQRAVLALKHIKGKKSIPPALFFILPLFLFFFFSSIQSVKSQDIEAFEEISIYLNVQKIGGTEITALTRDKDVLLSIMEIFEFLKIKVDATQGFDTVSGFFLNPQNPYIIDRVNQIIQFQGVPTKLKPGELLRTETGIYLKINYFGSVFGLDCSFNFRSLSVTMNTKVELPIIREMRLVQMRQNISVLRGEAKPDTFLPKKNPFIHFGTLDWSLIGTQQLDGQSETRFNFGLGGLVAGGEAMASLNFSEKSSFSEKQQVYFWRYANNKNRIIKQFTAGKISTQATSSIFAPVVGISFSNSPTSFRKSFGTFPLSNYTNPGWIVELYVNNVLVDYVKADAQGFFTFEVPMVYGNSSVTLRFYGPWGEEITKTENISIPFNFLPKGNFEYQVNAGLVEDGQDTKFSRATVQYGISRRLTLGGGYEHLSSVVTGADMPFLNSSLRLASSFLVSAEYTHNVRTKANFNFRLPANMQVEVYYTRFKEGQKAVNFSNIEERKAVLSKFFNSNYLKAFARFTVNQMILKTSEYTTAELLMSGSLFGISTNLTTNARFASPAPVTTYSNLSMSFSLPFGISFSPSTQFNYYEKEFVSVKGGFERRLFGKGMFSLSFERNFISDIQNIEFSYRFDLPYVQSGVSVRQSTGTTMLVESARGSIVGDAKLNYLGFTNRGGTGKGGVVIVPFLDLNCNNIRDTGEPKTEGLVLHVNGGKVVYIEKDTTIRIFDLEPFLDYNLTFEQTNFDNISWKIRNKIIGVTIDPNQFKLVELPVSVYGEASGMVYLNRNGEEQGMGRILVEFFRLDSLNVGERVGKALTESDGYFSFLGFSPGRYMARVDSAQMAKLGMEASTPRIFEIHSSNDGDLVDDFEFKLKYKEKKIIENTNIEVITPLNSADSVGVDSALTPEKINNKENGSKQDTVSILKEILPDEKNEEPKSVSEIKPDTINPAAEEIKPRGPYYIQVGAFKNKNNAISAKEKLAKTYGDLVVIIELKGLSNVRVTGFNTKAEALNQVSEIARMGFPGSVVFKSRK